MNTTLMTAMVNGASTTTATGGGPITAMAGKGPVQLESAFSDFWDTLVGATGFGAIEKLMSIVGVCLVVLAVLKWAWDRRRGGGMGQSGAVWGALLVGAILSAPAVLFPVFLFILDTVANGVISIWNDAKNEA
ncbi:hypothetical protein [Nocardioides sp. Leaf285]|uniref:hypothetical protein n=1 Tax=Nocardioides sp. Leaf285 TaxID=1736322 RepID=UPI0007037D2A|nr:hypothetical protein [Nocardioides sp. Leaf285]KQP62877.1 hypothetical protein ASF47_17850 [Nocardioides sp. Leaf285]